MNIAPTFEESLVPPTAPKYHLERWPQVVSDYENGKSKAAVLGLLDYIDPTIRQSKGNNNEDEFVIPNGSINIYLSLKNDIIAIAAPFLGLPVKNRVALLRQIAEINFEKMNLAQIILAGERLYFEYETPLALCNPWKIYDVLREICNNADYYDDFFIEKFGAIRIDPIQADQFPPEKIAYAWTKYQEMFDEAFAYIKHLEETRYLYNAMDQIFILLTRLQYYLAPQGFLKTRIDRLIEDMYQNLELSTLISKLKKELVELKNIDQQKFSDALYLPHFLIPTRTNADLLTFQNSIRGIYETARQEMPAGQYKSIYYRIMANLMKFFYENEFSNATFKSRIIQAMVHTSGKTWKEAVEILMAAIKETLDVQPDEYGNPV